jgi:uncharacterized protein with PhoU and TrkA domain
VGYSRGGKKKMQVHKKKEIMKDILENRSNVIDLIVEMKNLSGLAIDLGFSALLLQDKKLAEKVKQLAEEMDIKQYEIQTECMLAASNPQEALGLTSVIRVASAVADISNAVNSLTDIILRGMPLHPTVSEALKTAASNVDYIKINKRSQINNRPLEEIIKHGVDILGLKRNDLWSYQPKMEEKIRSEDMLIITGGKKSLDDIRKMNRAKSK